MNSLQHHIDVAVDKTDEQEMENRYKLKVKIPKSYTVWCVLPQGTLKFSLLMCMYV